MVVKLTVTAVDPLYKCWKRASNSIRLELMQNGGYKSRDQIFELIEERYSCKTIFCQRTTNGLVRHAELEFPGDKHVTMFMLIWSKK